MQDIENKLEILSSRIQKLLEHHGVESCIYTADKQLLRLNGEGKLEIDLESMKSNLLDNQIPIVTNFLAHENKYRLYDPINIAEIITRETKPMKLMFLSSEKGIRDQAGKVVSDIILPLGNLPIGHWCHGDTKNKIERIGHLLEKMPPESSVILTSADTVIQELFTHHGSGTMIKRSEPVKKFESLDEVNIEELGRLLSESFQKPLPEDYFSGVRENIDSIYVSESYSAAVIILRLPNIDVPYMDKFAVRTSSQGIGLTTQVWSEVVKDYPKLFWRSNVLNNGANGWYNTVCQGSWKDRFWNVYWYGLHGCEEVFPLIDFALKRKATFESVDSAKKESGTDSSEVEKKSNDDYIETQISESLDFGFMYDSESEGIEPVLTSLANSNNPPLSS